MTSRRSARLYRLIGWFGTSRLVTRLHPPVYRLTGGRGVVGRTLGMRNVILVTTGRSTGRRREVPLFAAEDGDRLVVVGSNAGGPTDPAWVGNLRARPELHVLVGRDERAMRAREVHGEERERLWTLAVAGYPGYADYAARTDRRIPVFALEPSTEEGAA
jgi:deazaflavin-dependent oxidoreductase (nitroreductase family)